MTASATAEELTAILGEIDPVILGRILDVGATTDEVAAALSSIEDEDTFGEQHHVPSSPRAAEVRSILEELFVDDRDDEMSIPLAGSAMSGSGE